MSTEPVFEATTTRAMAARYRRVAELFRMTGRPEDADEMDGAALRFEASAVEIERERMDQ